MHKAGICYSFGTRRAGWHFLARLFPPSSDTICLCETLKLPSVNLTVNTQLSRLLGRKAAQPNLGHPWEGMHWAVHPSRCPTRQHGGRSLLVFTLLPGVDELLMPPMALSMPWASKSRVQTWSSTRGWWGTRAICSTTAAKLCCFHLLPFLPCHTREDNLHTATYNPCHICAIQNIIHANIPETASTPKTGSALEKKPSLASSCQQHLCDQLCLSLASGFHHSSAQILQAQMPQLQGFFASFSLEISLFVAGGSLL